MDVYQLFLEEERKETIDRQRLLTKLKKDLEEKVRVDIEATVRKYLKS